MRIPVQWFSIPRGVSSTLRRNSDRHASVDSTSNASVFKFVCSNSLIIIDERSFSFRFVQPISIVHQGKHSVWYFYVYTDTLASKNRIAVVGFAGEVSSNYHSVIDEAVDFHSVSTWQWANNNSYDKLVTNTEIIHNYQWYRNYCYALRLKKWTFLLITVLRIFRIEF